MELLSISIEAWLGYQMVAQFVSDHLFKTLTVDHSSILSVLCIVRTNVNIYNDRVVMSTKYHGAKHHKLWRLLHSQQLVWYTHCTTVVIQGYTTLAIKSKYPDHDATAASAVNVVVKIVRVSDKD